MEKLNHFGRKKVDIGCQAITIGRILFKKLVKKIEKSRALD